MRKSRTAFSQMSIDSSVSKSQTGKQKNPRTNKKGKGKSKTIITPAHRFETTPSLLLTNVKSPGTGLFTMPSSSNNKSISRPQSRNSKMKLPPMPYFNNTTTSFTSNLTREVEEKVENQMISILENKLKSITTDSEREKAARMEKEIQIKQLLLQLQELQRNKTLVDDQVIREREVKRVFEKEVTKLKE